MSYSQRTKNVLLALILFCAAISPVAHPAAFAAPAASDTEYRGQFSAELAPATEDPDQVTFKPVIDLSKIKFTTKPDAADKVTGAYLFDPLQDKPAVLALLFEPPGAEPFMRVDLNNNRVIEDDERIALKKGADGNPYILEATINLRMKSSLFQSYPIFVQYYKDVASDELKEGERLVLQSKEAFARGIVDVAGRKTMVQYIFNPRTKKINALNGSLGIDTNGDGHIDTDRFSSESAAADDETIVFHLGDHYVSTKRVDVEKNEIVLREHPATDYKRIELEVGAEMPDFTFTDFRGKKRRLSEFRGKYVLVDFWAAWCCPCRRELPYQKYAYTKFQTRGFEILGMNNDPEPQLIKPLLEKNGLTWPQATMDSIKSLEMRYRIHLFPTTLLLGPDGKVISLNQQRKDQPQLRGEDLVKSLDKLLPR